jgi:hypothetical protein
MKVIESFRRDGTSTLAIVEVDAGEAADIDGMLGLVDDNSENFGFDVQIVSTHDAPTIKVINGRAIPDRQFGFEGASELRKRKRYYQIHVRRG